jgi:hypothetical protein
MKSSSAPLSGSPQKARSASNVRAPSGKQQLLGKGVPRSDDTPVGGSRFRGFLNQVVALLKFVLYLAVYLFLLLALLRPVDEYFPRSIPMLPDVADSYFICAGQLVIDSMVAVLCKFLADKMGGLIKFSSDEHQAFLGLVLVLCVVSQQNELVDTMKEVNFLDLVM